MSLSLALLASLISIRIGVSVALLEIGLGILGGNFLHLSVTTWISFLASFGSVLLTFLAGAEIDPTLMRAKLKESVGIGLVSFLFLVMGAFLFCFQHHRALLHHFSTSVAR
jgi:Kef-type K+ transport system membrane component KefB